MDSIAASGFNEDRVVGLILARGGSKGLPRKNLRPLAGVPLVARAVETLLLVPAISRVVVSTDDAEIASMALAYGAEIPFMRPAELAADDTPAMAAVEHAARALNAKGERAATIVLVQATAPGVRPEHVRDAIELFRRARAGSLRSVTPITEHPHWMGSLSGGRYRPLYPASARAKRRQDLPTLYRLNGAITIVRTERLLAGLGEEEQPLAYVMDAPSSVDIDTEEDFTHAQAVLAQGIPT